MRHLTAVAVALTALAGYGRPAGAQDVDVDGPEVFLRNIPFSISVSGPTLLEPAAASIRLGDGTVVADTTIEPLGSVVFNRLVVSSRSQLPIEVRLGNSVATADGPLLPGWVSILPPLVAIVLALVFREVVTSLFVGVWTGCLLLTGFNPLTAVFMTANRFARGEVSDTANAAIILFTLMLGGMVGVVTRMGGMRAIVDAVTPLATSRRRGQLATWLAGVAIFFDDYSNSLIVGNTMRPLTDRLKISREKLAYIVDSTAAPVAAVFFISTWIGYEVSLIGSGLDVAAQQHASDPVLVGQLQAVSPFGIFLRSIPYLFYPLLAILMVGALGITGRDYGPMLEAERRALTGRGLYRKGAQLAADMGTELNEAEYVPEGRWWNGALPVLVLVATVLVGLVTTGIDALSEADARTLRNIFGNADPYSPLLWGSILACLTALALAVGQRILTIAQGIQAWLGGLRAMLLAIVILVFAWSLGEVTQTLETASFLAGSLSETLPPALLPMTVFIVSAVIAFATGTSWATMAILVPLVIPLSITMAGGISMETGAEQAIVLGGVGSVLAGAIMGDHCSPISDTTVLSSTASSCDHLDHVRTQLPYAGSVALISILFGNVPSALGLSVWLCLLLSSVAVVGAVWFLGKPVEERER